MAGSPAKIRLSSLMHQRRLPPKMQMPLLVRSSITINGRKFTTTIHEGASAEELIAKVAKENGGGVAKVYYPEFNTHEIVAVKIGDQMIVKGDPSKVNEGDFSDFADSDSVRRAAVAASSSSKGGIHFFVGRDGIPMAAAENQGILFPNANELRVNTNINNLSLAVVDYNVDPNSIRDINKLYRKGANISLDAKREIEKSHGGVRSEKLMLPDTSVLILSRESGDIRTASEFASNFKTEGFMIKTANARQLATPPQAKSGLQLPTDLGVMHVPMDGSPFKIPYLCVRVFDGKLTDAINVRTNPPHEAQQEGLMEAAEPELVHGQAAEPEAIRTPDAPAKSDLPCQLPPEHVKPPAPKIETILSYFNNCPRVSKLELPIQENRAISPRNAPSKDPEPAQQRKESASKALQADSGGKKKTLKEVVHQKLSKSRRKKTRKSEPAREKKKPPKEKPKPKKAKKKKAEKKPAPAKKKTTARKIRESKRSKTKKSAKAAKAPKPKKTKPKPSKSRKKKKSGNGLVKISTNWSAKKSKKMSKKKKKKIQSYYLNTVLGLFKSKRSGAKSSRRKRKASRT